MFDISICDHPALKFVCFEAVLPASLDGMSSPPWVADLVLPSFPAPVRSSDHVRDEVRTMLRVTGFKPAGRNKPCPEYRQVMVQGDAC